MTKDTMNSQGSWLSMEDLGQLLSWQYKHIVRLDDFFISTSDGSRQYKSIFLSERTGYNRTFVGEIIQRLNNFGKGIGQDLSFRTKPLNDIIENQEFDEELLANFIRDYDTLDYGTIYSMQTEYVWRFSAELRATLTTILDFVTDREFDYIQNLNPEQGHKEARWRIFQLESDKIKTPSSCRLRDAYREKELMLYKRLENHYQKNQIIADNVPTIMNTTIHNSGHGNIINTGNQSTIHATINQANTQSVSDEQLIEEVKQLLLQVNEVVNRVIGIEAGTKEDILDQITIVERQISKENPKLNLIGKSLQVIETLLMDAASSMYVPVILEGIRNIVPLLSK